VNLVVPGVGNVALEIEEVGAGSPFLLLHGGAGPASMRGFAELLGSGRGARVILPTHPGFALTDRPPALTDVHGLASTYSALLEALSLDRVTVIGNSVGGWIAAELGLLEDPRVTRLVLVDAVGIAVPGHPVTSVRGFEVLPDAGHMPQMETPEQLLRAISADPPVVA
jgi:pimeloyl-ACP methyl ester carboxylesterase